MKRGGRLKRRPRRTVTFNCGDCGALVQRARVGTGVYRSCLQRRRNAARDYKRSGETLICAQCGEGFYAPPSDVARGRRFCSQRCMGLANRAKRRCIVCGDEFESKWGPRKTCSRKCTNEAKRQGKIAERNPNYVDGSTAALQAWLATRESACRRCGIAIGQLHLHHVVYRQHVKAAGGEIYDQRDGLTLCGVCHLSHHGQRESGKLPLAHLRDENFEFAVELLGTAAYDYLRRRYGGDDPRLDALLPSEVA